MIRKLFPLISIILVWLTFSSPFFIWGRVAFPSDYQADFFPPWSAYEELSGPVKNNAQPDIITQIYPWRYFAINEIKQGRIPLWNPYSFSGTPHLANYQSAVLTPFNLLFFLPLDFIDAWSLLVLLQPLLAGLFMYLFVRKLKLSNYASLLSSFSFMFCGFITAWMGYATLAYSIIFIPLALFLIENHISSKRNIWLVLLSLTFPLSFFSGHFQSSLYFLLAVFLYIFYGFFTSKKKRIYAKILLYVLFGIFLIMPQVVPSIEFYFLSVRSGIFSKFEAIPLTYFPTLFAPDFYGNPVTRNDWFGHYAEWSGFAGAICFAFSLFTIFFNRTKKAFFFIILAVISLLLAYDTPVLSFLVLLKIPVISTSAASRIIILLSFSLAVLGGMGFDYILKSKATLQKYFIWAGAVLFVILASFLLTFLGFIPKSEVVISQRNLIFPAAAIFLAVCGSFFLVRSKKGRYRIVIVFLILILSAFEMYRFASKWQSFNKKERAFMSLPITEFYRKINSHERVFSDFTAENSTYYRLQFLNGYDPLYPARYGEFVKAVDVGRPKSGNRSVVIFPKKGKYTSPAIDLMGVKYFLHKNSDGQLPWAFPFNSYPLDRFTKVFDDSNIQVFRNNQAYPRAFVVSKALLAKSDDDAIDNLFKNDPMTTAVVEDEIELNNGSGSAKITEYLPGKVTIDVKTSDRSLLVLTDNFYPGWKAYVNGVNEKIYRTDYTFRGVIIPKGESRVTFSYNPLSFHLGVYLFLLGILGIIVANILHFLSSKK